jgi:hypothetical protein
MHACVWLSLGSLHLPAESMAQNSLVYGLKATGRKKATLKLLLLEGIGPRRTCYIAEGGHSVSSFGVPAFIATTTGNQYYIDYGERMFYVPSKSLC